MSASVRIPRDPAKRAALAKLAGLTDEERAALDQWCFDQEEKRQRGVLLSDTEPRQLPTTHDMGVRTPITPIPSTPESGDSGGGE